jgi:hypothetical protein
MRRLLVSVILLIAAWRSPAEVIDRIAIVVDRDVITAEQLDEEIRVTAMLNQQSVVRDLQTRRQAAARLLEQNLVRHEMELNQFPLPDAGAVDRLYAETADELGGASAMPGLLRKYQLTEAAVRDHLRFQLTLLKYINFRFRPDVEVTDSDVRERYAREMAKWPKANGEPPSLEASRAALEKTIADERVDQALSLWLENTKREATISYLIPELQPK